MAGHSKWKKIQHHKSKQDDKKSKIYSSFAKEIRKMARINNNINHHTQLKVMVNLAKSNGVPKKVIEKALNPPLKDGKEILYECFAQGVSFLIQCYTNNINRTVSQLRSVLKNFGGSLSPCSFLFKKMGVLVIEESMDNAEWILEYSEDFLEEENYLTFYFSPDKYLEITNKIATENYNIRKFVVEYIPMEKIYITNDDVENFQNLIQELEELEDVESIIHNGNCDIE